LRREERKDLTKRYDHQKKRPITKKKGEKMKYKLREVIDSLEFDELVKMKKDVEQGGFHLKKFLESKITEEEGKHKQYCSNCSAELSPGSTNNFTLVFGPEDFRKKASFCGIDCLEYFISELKKMKKVMH
jgi:hypothetical protein